MQPVYTDWGFLIVFKTSSGNRLAPAHPIGQMGKFRIYPKLLTFKSLFRTYEFSADHVRFSYWERLPGNRFIQGPGLAIWVDDSSKIKHLSDLEFENPIELMIDSPIFETEKKLKKILRILQDNGFLVDDSPPVKGKDCPLE